MKESLLEIDKYESLNVDGALEKQAIADGSVMASPLIKKKKKVYERNNSMGNSGYQGGGSGW